MRIKIVLFALALSLLGPPAKANGVSVNDCHGEIRLTQAYSKNGYSPLRMQKFDGVEALEGVLECK